MQLNIFNSNDALLSGDPLYVGFDLTIASFDSISEVSMVSAFKISHDFIWKLPFAKKNVNTY